MTICQPVLLLVKHTCIGKCRLQQPLLLAYLIAAAILNGVRLLWHAVTVALNECINNGHESSHKWYYWHIWIVNKKLSRC